MGTKTIGARTTLEFAVECMRRGAIVSDPIGDDAPYDLLVDVPGERIFRVQVKTAFKWKSKGTLKLAKGGFQIYRANTQRIVPQADGKSKAFKYKEGEIDTIVTRAGAFWYLLEEAHKLPGQVNLVPENPAKKGKHEKWRDNWKAIGLQEAPEPLDTPEIDPDEPVHSEPAEVDDEETEIEVSTLPVEPPETI